MEITAKRPWLSSLGDVPATLEYFHGSMVDMVEDAAKKYPDSIAFDFMGRSTTYREMVANIERCARSLRTIGVRQNDRVTIAMPNCPQAIYMFYRQPNLQTAEQEKRRRYFPGAGIPFFLDSMSVTRFAPQSSRISGST